MSDKQSIETKKDIFIELYREHGLWSRHQESQRAVVSNLIITISAALIGFIVFDQKINISDLPVSIFIVILGIFGMVFSYKHYERFHHHDARTEAYKDELNSLMTDVSIDDVEEKADLSSGEKFQLLSKYRLYTFWIIFNFVILSIGLVLSYASVFGVSITQSTTLSQKKVECNSEKNHAHHNIQMSCEGTIKSNLTK